MSDRHLDLRPGNVGNMMRSRTPAAWVPAPPKWRLTCRDCPMEQRICRMTRSALQFLQCTKLCVSNSNLFWHVVEGSGRAPQISGRLWHVREGFWEALGSVLDGFGRFWEALEGSECSPGRDLHDFGRPRRVRKRSGRFWKALGDFGKLRIAAGSLLAAYGM